MNKKTLSLSLALPMAFVVGSLAPVGPQGAKPDISKVLAVVDMDKVRRAYPRAQKLQEGLKQRAAELETMLTQRKNALNDMRMTAQRYDELTPEWIDADSKFAGAQAELERWAKRSEASLQKQRLDALSEISDAIQKAVAKLAQQRGLEIVFHVRTAAKGAPPAQILEVQQLNDVIYHVPKLDLTDDVIKMMK